MQASSDKVPEKRSAHHPVLAVELNFDAERQALLKVFDEVRRKGVNLDVDVFQEGAAWDLTSDVYCAYGRKNKRQAALQTAALTKRGGEVSSSPPVRLRMTQ
jgi:hypothetical protein